MDWLIQRYLPGTANEAHKNSGSWEDVAVVRDKSADEGEEAALEAMAGVPPLYASQPDRLRAIKYEHLEEFDAVLGPPQLSKGEKGLRGNGK